MRPIGKIGPRPEHARSAAAAPRSSLVVFLALAWLAAASSATAGTADVIFSHGFEALAAKICLASGTSCTSDSECCNSLCDRPAGATTGQCAALGACATVGEPCGAIGLSGTCCSGACLASNDDGSSTCQRIGGCRLGNELCTVSSECCSESCAPSGTTDDGRTILRCALNPTCSPPGERCDSNSNCCPAGGGSTGCEPATTGLARCLGGTPGCVLPGDACTDTSECCTDSFPGILCQTARSGRSACCLSTGQSCAFGDVCCSGICAPEAGGNLVCKAGPVSTGGACTTHADCEGGCCEKNALGALACSAECAVCTQGQLGEVCDIDSPCCPGLSCDAADGICRL